MMANYMQSVHIDDYRAAVKEIEEELNAELAMKRVYIQQIATLESQLAEARSTLSAIALYDCSAWAVGGRCDDCPACIADKALSKEIEQ